MLDLSSAPHSTDWGLSLCFIAPQPLSNEVTLVECKGYLRIGDDDADDKEDVIFEHGMDCSNLTSDHVTLWYNDFYYSRLHPRIKESRATYNPRILFKMKVHYLFWDNDHWQRYDMKIKSGRSAQRMPRNIRISSNKWNWSHNLMHPEWDLDAPIGKKQCLQCRNLRI